MSDGMEVALKQEQFYPRNVRQIGEIPDGYRIYIEDYVYTYLHQYAANNKNEDQIAFLIGEGKFYDNEHVLLITGAIQGKLLQKESASLEIHQDTWDYVLEKKQQYFADKQIVGWVYTQPGYGILLTSFLTKQHEAFFEEGHVLYILDPIEKEDAFFQTCGGNLVQREGFFIFYDKNEAMHSYIMDHKVSTTEYELKQQDVVTHFRMKEMERKEAQHHKRIINMLTALCSALMVLCIIIGMGLIKNAKEMNRLKDSVNAKATYNELYPVASDATPSLAEDISQLDLSQLPSTQEVNTPIHVGQEEAYADILDEIPAGPAGELVPQGSDTPGAGYSSLIPETYTVKPGDNLISISIKFYNTADMVDEIVEMNGIKTPNRIIAGQVLKLPRPEN